MTASTTLLRAKSSWEQRQTFVPVGHVEVANWRSSLPVTLCVPVSTDPRTSTQWHSSTRTIVSLSTRSRVANPSRRHLDLIPAGFVLVRLWSSLGSRCLRCRRMTDSPSKKFQVLPQYLAFCWCSPYRILLGWRLMGILLFNRLGTPCCDQACWSTRRSSPPRKHCKEPGARSRFSAASMAQLTCTSYDKETIV